MSIEESNLLIAELLTRLSMTVTEAAADFAEALMAGDPSTFKAGYSRDNAVIAACEVFVDADREALEAALDERGVR